MKASDICAIYLRDIEALKAEINAYTDENCMWIIDNNIQNSAGNLCLHLIGNLNHFIGHLIGKTGYLRNREEEFSAKNISREQLIQQLNQTAAVVENSLAHLPSDSLEKTYPIELGGKSGSTEYYLLFFACHFNYHLGQINYHRRLMCN